MKELQTPRKVFAIGECMVEFLRLPNGDYRRAYAGDVYNMAVYLKRIAQEHCTVEFVTAVGDDTASLDMMRAWRAEDIATAHVVTCVGKAPGLYIIETDQSGERCFSYWREQSAARDLVLSLAHLTRKVYAQGDLIYFSGITLAILNPVDRKEFFAFIKRAKKDGVLIAFDPNYRAALWESRQVAADAAMTAYGLSDIIITGAKEEQSLFDRSLVTSELVTMAGKGVGEVIVKAGLRGIYGKCGTERFHLPVQPASHVVDTTAAGDSFAGAYLAFRLQGTPPRLAAKLAADVARIVVTMPGAIAEREEFFAQLHQDDILADSEDGAPLPL